MSANGFGKQPNLDRPKRLMAKAIEARNLDQIRALVNKFSNIHGRETIYELLASDVLAGECSPEATDWYWRSILPPEQYREFKDRMQHALISALHEQGYELGKDFSFTPDGGVMMANAVHEKVLSFVPERYRDRFINESNPVNQVDAGTALENHLGVPFFDNLLVRVKNRYGEFTDVEFADYVMMLAAGFTARHPEMEEDFFSWLFGNIVREYKHLKPYLTNPDQIPELGEERQTDIGVTIMEDLIVAAGGVDCLKTFDDGHVGISRDGIKLLAEVWQGDRFSPYELIAAMDCRFGK